VKNGCKDFISPTMDKIKIEPFFENRLHDIAFAQVSLRHLNNRGVYLEDTIQLTQELYKYIIYLYSHIEQLEKDKMYLLEQSLKKQAIKRRTHMRSYTMNPFDYEKAWEQRFNLDVTKGMEVIVDNNKTF